jgi:hypothetical protein
LIFPEGIKLFLLTVLDLMTTAIVAREPESFSVFQFTFSNTHSNHHQSKRTAPPIPQRPRPQTCNVCSHESQFARPNGHLARFGMLQRRKVQADTLVPSRGRRLAISAAGGRYVRDEAASYPRPRKQLFSHEGAKNGRSLQ